MTQQAREERGANGHRNGRSTTTKEGADSARSLLSQVADEARGRVTERFDSKKVDAVETLGGVAAAIRKTATRTNPTVPLPDLADRAAEGLDRLAAYVENADLAAIARDVKQLAQRQPVLFVGSAFLAGLLGARFVKATAKRTAAAVETAVEDAVEGSEAKAEEPTSEPAAAAKPEQESTRRGAKDAPSTSAHRKSHGAGNGHRDRAANSRKN